MADYAIGDVQGCYDSLMLLLEKIEFDERVDRLWFVGDLVNRGPKSLNVLQFVKNLPIKPRVVLGNHDLHLLCKIYLQDVPLLKGDTLNDIINSPDVYDYAEWLRRQPLLYHDLSLNVVMTHAGIAPNWSLGLAKKLAQELEQVLAGPNFLDFLQNMYGNEPNYWSGALKGIDRLRAICNYFTRMRFCDSKGCLNLSYKGTVANAPQGLTPWFAAPNRVPIDATIVFGHWASLRGECDKPCIYAIDTGCLWGGSLTALNLDNLIKTSVACVDQINH